MKGGCIETQKIITGRCSQRLEISDPRVTDSEDMNTSAFIFRIFMNCNMLMQMQNLHNIVHNIVVNKFSMSNHYPETLGGMEFF